MDALGNSMDDSASAGSSPECPDRLSLLEMRLQVQEEEMTLVKSALNDALRRLSLYDEQIPLLKQKILAGSASILETFSNSGVLDNTSTIRKLSSSSMQDCCKPETSPTSSCATVNELKNRMNAILKQQSLINQQETRGFQQCFSPAEMYTAEKVTVATQTEDFAASLMQVSERTPFSIPGTFQDHNMNGQMNHVDGAQEQRLSTEAMICQSQVQKYEAVNHSKDNQTRDSQAMHSAHFNELQNHSHAQIQSKADELMEEACEHNSKLTNKNSEKESLISAVQATQKHKENENVQNNEQSEPQSSSESRQPKTKMENQMMSPICQSDLQSPLIEMEAMVSMQTNEPGVAMHKENGLVLQAIEKENQSSVPPESRVQRNEPRSPISAVQAFTANKKPLVQRSSTSDKLIKSAAEKSKQKLSQKAASSASLLIRSPSMEKWSKAFPILTCEGTTHTPQTYIYQLHGRTTVVKNAALKVVSAVFFLHTNGIC